MFLSTTVERIDSCEESRPRKCHSRHSQYSRWLTLPVFTFERIDRKSCSCRLNVQTECAEWHRAYIVENLCDLAFIFFTLYVRTRASTIPYVKWASRARALLKLLHQIYQHLRHPYKSEQEPSLKTERKNPKIKFFNFSLPTHFFNLADALPDFSVQSDQPSPSTATLEDVLASLLGLPSDSYRSSGTNL